MSQDPAAVAAVIRTLEDQRYAAMIAADRAALDALLSDRLIYTHSNASVDDKASYLAKIESKFFDYREIAHAEETLVVTGSTALVLGRMIARVVVDGRRELSLNTRTLTVWVEEDGSWRMLAFHPTPIPA